MVFDNQSIEMHVAIVVLAALATLASVLAAIFQGMYLHKVKSPPGTDNDNPRVVTKAGLATNRPQSGLETLDNWLGDASYGLDIAAVVLFTFITLYLGFDLKTRLRQSKRL